MRKRHAAFTLSWPAQRQKVADAIDHATKTINLMNVDPGKFLVDTGAQVPLIGKPALDTLIEYRKARGLPLPIWIHDQKAYTSGIGGKCLLLGEVMMPLGFAQINGKCVMKVADENVPPIIPMPMLRDLGATISSSANTITWEGVRRLGEESDSPPPVSQIVVMPSQHILVDGSDFDHEGLACDDSNALLQYRASHPFYAYISGGSAAEGEHWRTTEQIDGLVRTESDVTDSIVSVPLPSQDRNKVSFMDPLVNSKSNYSSVLNKNVTFEENSDGEVEHFPELIDGSDSDNNGSDSENSEAIPDEDDFEYEGRPMHPWFPWYWPQIESSYLSHCSSAELISAQAVVDQYLWSHVRPDAHPCDVSSSQQSHERQSGGSAPLKEQGASRSARETQGLGTMREAVAPFHAARQDGLRAQSPVGTLPSDAVASRSGTQGIRSQEVRSQPCGPVRKSRCSSEQENDRRGAASRTDRGGSRARDPRDSVVPGVDSGRSSGGFEVDEASDQDSGGMPSPRSRADIPGERFDDVLSLQLLPGPLRASSDEGGTYESSAPDRRNEDDVRQVQGSFVHRGAVGGSELLRMVQDDHDEETGGRSDADVGDGEVCSLVGSIPCSFAPSSALGTAECFGGERLGGDLSPERRGGGNSDEESTDSSRPVERANSRASRGSRSKRRSRQQRCTDDGGASYNAFAKELQKESWRWPVTRPPGGRGRRFVNRGYGGRLLQATGFLIHVATDAREKAPNLLGDPFNSFSRGNDGIWRDDANGCEYFPLASDDVNLLAFERETLLSNPSEFVACDMHCFNPNILQCMNGETHIALFDLDYSNFMMNYAEDDEEVKTVPSSVRHAILQKLPQNHRSCAHEELEKV